MKLYSNLRRLKYWRQHIGRRPILEAHLSIDDNRFWIDFLLDPRDVWVGLYWTLEAVGDDLDRMVEVYVCLIPTLVVCFTIVTRREGGEDD